MKKIIILMVVFINCLFISTIKATAMEVHYTNNQGVVFTKEEYDFISKFYFDGYQNFMNQEDYEKFINSGMMNGEINIQLLEENTTEKERSFHETSYKLLKLSSSCGSNSCTVVTSLSWKKDPAIKSYDLIGAYFNNTSLVGLVESNLFYGSKILSPIDTLQTSRGISATFDLPNTSELITVVQSFSVKKSGSVNVSYQHARKSITLNNSRKYDFSSGGYGGVFSFEESVRSYYDAMKGLSSTFS